MDKKKSMAFANLIGSILFIALGIWAWIQTLDFKVIKKTYVQPATFPQIMIVGMLIFAVILFVQSVYKLLRMKAEDPLAATAASLNPVKNAGVRNAYLVIVLCILFVALFKTAGYLVCGPVLALIIMYMIGKRNWVQMVLTSILVPLFMWLIFYKLLTVNIPVGPLQFLRDFIDTI